MGFVGAAILVHYEEIQGNIPPRQREILETLVLLIDRLVYVMFTAPLKVS